MKRLMIEVRMDESTGRLVTAVDQEGLDRVEVIGILENLKYLELQKLDKNSKGGTVRYG
jgi:hypothetical protein|tara:strand:+ start:74 stop:250 length:177 start_codon:yes stop_codon:yes gene_type:complete